MNSKKGAMNGLYFQQEIPNKPDVLETLRLSRQLRYVTTTPSQHDASSFQAFRKLSLTAKQGIQFLEHVGSERTITEFETSQDIPYESDLTKAVKCYQLFVCFDAYDEDNSETDDWEITNVVFGVEQFRFYQKRNLKGSYDMINLIAGLEEKYTELPDEIKDRTLLYDTSAMFPLGNSSFKYINVLSFIPEKTPELQKVLYKTLDAFDVSASPSSRRDPSIEVLTKIGENWSFTTCKAPDYFVKFIDSVFSVCDTTNDSSTIEIMSTSPKYFYVFRGVKYCSTTFLATLMEGYNSAESLATLVALKKYNNIGILDVCVKNFSGTQVGRMKVYSESGLNDLYKEIQQHLLRNFELNISLESISGLVPRCHETGFDIYSGKTNVADEITKVIGFHRQIKEILIRRYAYRSRYLVDIGSGRLRDAKLWVKHGIKNVLAIEPSEESTDQGIEKLKTTDLKETNIRVLNIEGQVPWTKEDIKGFINRTDCITFMFTIHYMVDKLRILINNIRRLAKVGTKVVITLLDEDHILKSMQMTTTVPWDSTACSALAKTPFTEDNKKERTYMKVVKDDELLLYAEDLTEPGYQRGGNYVDIFFYLNGVYGLQNGSFEKLVRKRWLIREFSNKGFELLEQRNFGDIARDKNIDFTREQFQITSTDCYMVFKYVGTN